MVVGEFTQETDLLVIGGGPGGYHAAFRAASHGIHTTIVDAESGLGGVCLHRGCIPSKTYLHLAELLHAAEAAKSMGIDFGKPKLDIAALRGWKEQVVSKLVSGLDLQCKKHGVAVVLVGEEFWRRVFDADFLAAEGVIDPEDVELFWFAETAEEIWDGICQWYEDTGEPLVPNKPCPTDAGEVL